MPNGGLFVAGPQEGYNGGNSNGNMGGANPYFGPGAGNQGMPRIIGDPDPLRIGGPRGP